MSEQYRGPVPASGNGPDPGDAAHEEPVDQHGLADAPHWEAPHDGGARYDDGVPLAGLHYEGHEVYEGHEAPDYEEGGHPGEDHLDALPSRRSSRVSKRVRKRRRSLVFLVILVLFAAVVYFAVQAVKPMLAGFQTPDYPGPGTGSVAFVVPEGATGRSIASELKAEDIVASEQAFLNALTVVKGAASLQPGTFEMKTQMKASDAVAELLAIGGNRVHYAAIAQNLRIGETLALLAESTGIPVAQFEELSKQPALFGLPKQATNLEGYLAPGEYRFPVETDAKTVLDELVTKTKDDLAAAGVTDPNQQFRIVTVASIIEFEGNAANYAMISGAIDNRLNRPNNETNGYLQSDATVAYGLGIKSYELTPAEKADKSNLYNTFAHPGLPVGPIGSPGPKAIEAAAHPEANPYYFWVTINLDTGETLYAATFAEHQANVAKYVAWCSANAGKCQ